MGTRLTARSALDGGADLVVAHLGITRPAADAAAAARWLAPIAAALDGVDALLLCHGGPLASPAAVHATLRACPGVAGSFGASAIERLPIERAVREAAAAYKHANPAGLALDAAG